MLKADKIAALLDVGEDPLVIVPRPDIEALKASGSASLDLRLGTWFVSLRQARMTHLEVQDEDASPRLTKEHYVPFGERFVLHPRSFVLSATLEWVRLSACLGAYVVGKSSWGRRGLIIATATGVHPGFKGCLTLELSNVGEVPVELWPGMTICQLFFHHVEAADDSAVDRSQFVGRRKPALGKLSFDTMAQALMKANQHGAQG